MPFWAVALVPVLVLVSRIPFQWPWRFGRSVSRFHSASTARVALHYAPELEGDLYLPAVFDRYHREVVYVSQQFGLELPAPVHVFLFADLGGIARIFGADYGGFALTKCNAIVVAAGTDTRDLLRHEFTHLFSARWNPSAPTLLCEGLSVWMQRNYWGRPIDSAVLPAMRDSTLTLARLLKCPGLFHRGDLRHACYLLAGSFTGFLIRQYGWERYRRFYRRARAIGLPSTFRKCFGISMEAAESHWRNETLTFETPYCPNRRQSMSNRDRKSIFAADNVAEAEVVAEWLAESGIPARVMDPAALEKVFGWVPFREFGVTQAEVWVREEADVTAANRLLTTRAIELNARLGQSMQPDARFELVCEICGTLNRFTAGDWGTVQTCQRCGEDFDVGDSGDDPEPDKSITECADEVMEFANQEALRFNQESVDTGHILLGLVKEGWCVATNVLANLEIAPVQIQSDLEKLLNTRLDYVTPRRLPPTPQARRVTAYAMEEARRLNHNYIGSEHILLGLLREKEGVAAQVLGKRGLTTERVREQVVYLLGDWTNTMEPGGRS